MTLPNGKIEDRAIGVLQELINRHPTMQPEFHRLDKGMSWDGSITIFNSNTEQSKRTYEAKVPVQIKGHVDNKKSYLNRQRITYPVEISDLKIYYYDGGVVYFQIFFTEDGTKKEIFYSLLFASKIKSYLDKADKKGNKSKINISFTKLRKDEFKFQSILRQYVKESRYQGSGSGQIVPLTIPLNSINNTTEISASVVEVSNGFELFERLCAGDVCFYVKNKGPIDIPIEWTDKYKVTYQERMHSIISIDKISFYQEYNIRYVSDGETIVVINKNVEIIFKESITVSFKPATSIEQISHDAEFVLKISNSNEISIGGAVFSTAGIKVSPEFQKTLELFIEINDTLKMIEFDYDKTFDTISKTDFNQLKQLVDLKNGKYNNYFVDSNETHIYDWKIEGKYLPIMVYRNNSNDKNYLVNAAYSPKHQMVYVAENGDRYKIPSFIVLKNSVFKNMYFYNTKFIREQIDSEEINCFSVDTLCNAILHLLNAYDETGDQELLKLAEYQANKIEEKNIDSTSFSLNRMQIKVRNRTFNESDRNRILKIQTDDKVALFCKNVLLGNKMDADIYLSELTNDEKECVVGWPIMKLYEDMQ